MLVPGARNATQRVPYRTFGSDVLLTAALLRLDQFVELIDQVVEVVQRLLHCGGLFEIDACSAQQVERILRAAALEETEIVVEFFSSSARHTLCQSNRRRQSGGVFVHIKCTIKMRYTKTLQ